MVDSLKTFLLAVRDVAPLLLLFAAGLAFLAWRRLKFKSIRVRYAEVVAVVLTLAGFGVIDWAMLAALPALGLSFGPVKNFVPLAAARFFSLLCAYFLAFLSARVKRISRLPGKERAQSTGGTAPFEADQRAGIKSRLGKTWISDGLVLAWLVNLALLATAIYSMYIEPFDLRISQIDLPAPASWGNPALLPGRSLRIVQLSDIHVEQITRRETQMLATVTALAPDLILLTGDYLNIDYKYDPVTQQQGREVLSQLSAPYGVYAIAGTRGVDPPEVMQAIFTGLDIQVLNDQVVRLQVGDGSLYLVGVTHHGRQQDSIILGHLMATIPQEAYTILLYHTPDLIEAAAENQVDLYLAGHTHGGQVRLPFYGALVTMSYYGKQYESGLYTLKQTRLYVSRGIGMEGLGLPRLRFLCPPEIVLIHLGNEE